MRAGNRGNVRDSFLSSGQKLITGYQNRTVNRLPGQKSMSLLRNAASSNVATSSAKANSRSFELLWSDWRKQKSREIGLGALLSAHVVTEVGTGRQDFDIGGLRMRPVKSNEQIESPPKKTKTKTADVEDGVRGEDEFRLRKWCTYEHLLCHRHINRIMIMTCHDR